MARIPPPGMSQPSAPQQRLRPSGAVQTNPSVIIDFDDDDESDGFDGTGSNVQLLLAQPASTSSGVSNLEGGIERLQQQIQAAERPAGVSKLEDDIERLKQQIKAAERPGDATGEFMPTPQS